MYFRVASEIFGACPDACFGVVVAEGIKNTGSDPRIMQLVEGAVVSARKGLAETGVRGHPYIAVWRDTFTRLGYNPNKFLSSVEALATRVVKGNSLPSVNAVVDLVNALSLKYLLPMGAHDLGRMAGDMELRASREGDIFTPFGETTHEAVPPGEVVYADAREVRTRKWVWRQGNNAKIELDTTTVFFPIDGFTGVNRQAVEAARDELAALATQYLGARTRCYFVDASRPEADLGIG